MKRPFRAKEKHPFPANRPEECAAALTMSKVCLFTVAQPQ